MLRMRRGAPLVAMGAGMYAGRKMAQSGAAKQDAAAQQAQMQQEQLAQLQQQNAQLAQMNQQLAQQPAAAAPAPAPAAPAPAAAGGDDTVAQLTKLAQLRDAGALSPEEFEQAKAKVLA